MIYEEKVQKSNIDQAFKEQEVSRKIQEKEQRVEKLK